MIQGRTKVLLITILFILVASTLPAIALPLPYEGLDWLSYRDKLSYGYYMRVRAYFPLILKNYQ